MQTISKPLSNPITNYELLDLAYAVFLEMAEEHLSLAQIELFNHKFPQEGELVLCDTAEDWEEEIGVLIDPSQYAEVWITLNTNLDDSSKVSYTFAKCLINLHNPTEDFHIVWNSKS